MLAGELQFTAEDAEGCSGNHPDGLLRHDIQKPE